MLRNTSIFLDVLSTLSLRCQDVISLVRRGKSPEFTLVRSDIEAK